MNLETLNYCHLERSRPFAKRIARGVERPHTRVNKDEPGKAFSR
jgi:hypothetical protein